MSARTYIAPTDVREVRAGGLGFACVEAGEGPLVLLLHGFPDTPRTWSHVMQPLAEAGYHAVAPFMRGYAPSEIPADPKVTMEELGRDALALIDALGYESAVVVGHDWGAAAAYAAEALGSERLTKLVTVGTPHPAAVRPTPRIAWAARHFISFRRRSAARKLRRDDFALLDQLVRRWSPTWDFGPDELEPVKNSFAAPGSVETALGYYRAVGLGGTPKFLRVPVRTPSLAFAGGDDPAFRVEDYERAARRFEAPCEIAVLPGGHFLHRESPDAFTERLLAFLGAP